MAHTPKTPKMKPKPKQRRRERTPNERDPKPLTLLDPSILTGVKVFCVSAKSRQFFENR